MVQAEFDGQTNHTADQAPKGSLVTLDPPSVIEKTHREVSSEDVLRYIGTIAEESTLASLTL